MQVAPPSRGRLASRETVRLSIPGRCSLCRCCTRVRRSVWAVRRAARTAFRASKFPTDQVNDQRRCSAASEYCPVANQPCGRRQSAFPSRAFGTKRAHFRVPWHHSSPALWPIKSFNAERRWDTHASTLAAPPTPCDRADNAQASQHKGVRRRLGNRSSWAAHEAA